MKSRFLLSLPLIGCFAFVSCFPIPNEKPPIQNPNTTITSNDQQKIEEQRKVMQEREKQRLAEEAQQPKVEEKITPPVQPPVQQPTSDYRFATPVPGKAGFVFSPYNNKLVDVRDIPSGTLVQDPTYPPSEKKYFRVP